MSIDDTRERARRAREDGPLGESPDAHALKWTLPGTRRVWNVVLGSMASMVALFPMWFDDAGWITWGALLLLTLAVVASWVLIATPDLVIEVQGNTLVWKRGRQRQRFALQDVHAIRWERVSEKAYSGDAAEKVHRARLVLETEAGPSTLDGLTVSEVVGEKKDLSYGELLTSEDYDRLCAQVQAAADRARQLGTEQDVPEAMRRLAAKRAE